MFGGEGGEMGRCLRIDKIAPQCLDDEEIDVRPLGARKREGGETLLDFAFIAERFERSGERKAVERGSQKCRAQGKRLAEFAVEFSGEVGLGEIVEQE